MPNTQFSGVIRLRKDTEANFALIQNSFIPEDGEVCLIETSTGIRVKVGDGESFLSQIDYIDVNLINQINNVVKHGYYLNGKFWTDSTYTIVIPAELTKIYIDANTDVIYNYNGSQYVSINDTLPNATDVQSGIMKLYTTKGIATDGTMTQKSITDNLNTKVEVSVDKDNETVVFSISL